MFEEKSRYNKTEQYHLKDVRGRSVAVVAVPDKPVQVIAGTHLLKHMQRMDHLAAKYLNDPAGFWRICEINGVMLSETLTEQLEIDIPQKNY